MTHEFQRNAHRLNLKHEQQKHYVASSKILTKNKLFYAQHASFGSGVKKAYWLRWHVLFLFIILPCCLSRTVILKCFENDWPGHRVSILDNVWKQIHIQVLDIKYGHLRLAYYEVVSICVEDTRTKWKHNNSSNAPRLPIKQRFSHLK